MYQGSEYTSSSKYARALNIPFRKYKKVWFCQGSEHASISKYAIVLNIPFLKYKKVLLCQCSEYTFPEI